MLSRILKSLEDAKAGADTYPHDEDMANKANKILFQLDREISIWK